MPDARALRSAAGRRLTGLVRRPGRRPAAAAAVDPVLAAYLNEQLAAATALTDRVRRAAARDELAEEGPLLERVRRQVAADRARLRGAMKRLGVGVDWSVLGVAWVSGQAGRVLPLLHRVPPLERVAEVVDRLPTAHPQRQGDVLVLLTLEELVGELHRRRAAAAVLARWTGPDAAAATALDALLAEVGAAHARCAARLG